MYLTPVIYPESILQQYRWLITTFNPMYHLVRLFRLPLYDGRLPTWQEFLPALVFSLAVLLVGWFVFSRRADEFAYRV
jgi:ABC-type polysaccharide/polyol phosphate export permease